MENNMTVIFKKGQSLEIPQEVANAIANHITSNKGARQWQIFRDKSSTTMFVINLNEVLYIRSLYS